MSKGELLCLYKTTAAEKDNIAGKYGQYPRVSRGGIHQNSITHLMLPRSRKGAEEI